MSRFLRGLAALTTLIGLVAGVPYALVRFVGRPWPRPFPSLDVIANSIRSGDISDTTVIKALAIVVWIAWARLSASIVIEIAARLAGAQAPRIVGLGSAQRWAATLVAAVVLMTCNEFHKLSRELVIEMTITALFTWAWYFALVSV